ncbi:hypothetical protein LTR36_009546 [Oleoguttula mirabilis]|uniref:non-specific serine/threonine protein kinase n=1 Tax=Oleoguttula mirabilis TaxID=1507867 RepID=A0AAV9JSK0_9PEZI|nr:hypothetical protein LTR36_009546 [Oleoguttula mirabilis]
MAAAYSSSAAASASASSPHRNGAMHRTTALSAPTQPTGTFLPGTKVQVGSHRVTIEKYLSEGGFAHVYVVRIPRDAGKHETAVLKRVAVPDKDHLASMRTEVETMKKLKGHTKVVTYMDSHASQLKAGGYEVFLLMEYCAGGGLIDFMNTRLQHRLTEPEILKIFGDVAEGVACMHYLKPPLLHRDLKVENVLIAAKGSPGGSPTYKLCDFGSTAAPRPAAKTTEEGRLIEEDVQKHTTMQYRSPEMIDVWRKQPIDEKADIWALGVLLYKLCYYTTPFEDVGQMAILNASYKFPAYPAFSDRLKKLVGAMLKEDPKRRPNIYEVIREVCSMRGVAVPIKDIYAGRTQSEARRNETLPSSSSSSSSSDPAVSSPAVGLQKDATPQLHVQSIPDIAPMRRGRPTATATAQQAPAAKPSPSPARGDPFAALDSKNSDVRAGAVEELSKRFPSLDEFSIAQERGGGEFAFGGLRGSAAAKGLVGEAQGGGHVGSGSWSGSGSGLSVRVTHALADEVFGQQQSKTKPAANPAEAAVAKASPTKVPMASKVPLRDVQQQSPLMHQPTPVRPGVNAYKSTGVGSSPPPAEAKLPSSALRQKPIWRVPTDHHRSASQPRASMAAAQIPSPSLQPNAPLTRRPALLDAHRSNSQTGTLTAAAAKSPTSSRPSLEGHRPSHLELDDSSALSRAKSAQSRPRPSSVYVSSNLDYLRDQEAASASSALSRSKRPSMEARRPSRQASRDRESAAGEEAPIDSDMDYLRNTEEGDTARRKAAGRKGSAGHKKRASLPSISGATKSMFAGRFGDAFKRFEQRESSGGDDGDEAGRAAPVTPEPRDDVDDDEEEPRLLSPILGSEHRATPPPSNHRPRQSAERHGDDDSAVEETEEEEELPPDMRRELERRRLSVEERRVAEAAREYRARVTAQGTGSSGSGGGALPVTRASTIQKRVQSLLDEGRQSPVKRKTAEGYGKYTAPATAQEGFAEQAAPPAARKTTMPMLMAAETSSTNLPYPKTRAPPTTTTTSTAPPPPSVPTPSASAPPTPQALPARILSRPSVPPKSQALRTGGSGRSAVWPPAQQPPIAEPDKAAFLPPAKTAATTGGGLAALLARDMVGVPEYPASQQQRGSASSGQASGSAAPRKEALNNGFRPGGDAAAGDDDDVEGDFSKRYPDLGGIEMLETEIGGSSAAGDGRRPMRVREV